MNKQTTTTKTASAGTKKAAPAKKAAPKTVQAAATPAAETAASKQGAGTQSGEMRGGAKQVLIEVTKIEGRLGRIPGEEDYPFGLIKPCKKQPDGSLVGESFFIPESDRPKAKIAAARKRHRKANKVFLSRKATVDGVTGFRVWLEGADA